jgi:hypothetical protein
MNSLFRKMGRKMAGGAALLALMLGVSNLPAQTSSDPFARGGWKARGSQDAPRNQDAPKFQDAPRFQDTARFQDAPKFQDAPRNEDAPKNSEVRRTSAEEAFDDEAPSSQTPPNLFQAPPDQAPVAQSAPPQTPPWQRPPRRHPPAPGRQVKYQPGFDQDGPRQPMNSRMQSTSEDIPPGRPTRMQPGPHYNSGPQYNGPQYSGPSTGGTSFGGQMSEGYTPGDGSWIDGPNDWSGGPVDGGSCSSCGPGGSCGASGCGASACCGGPCDNYYEYGRPGLLDGIIGGLFHYPGWCQNKDGCYQPYGLWRPWAVLDESSVFLGTTSFKGPVDQGQNGNFGFQEGVNIAGSLLDWCGIGYQLGANFVQSNFHGDFVETVRTTSRDQQFITVGLFHRAWYGHGLQFGVAYDWMRDHYYVQYDISQIRGEISYLANGGHEVGFWGTTSNNTVVVNSNNLRIQQTLETTNIYAFFYRYNLCNGSQGRFWAGGAGTRQGIVGADFRVPVTNRWDLTGRFNYIIPNAPAGLQGLQQETWGMGVNLVWYPGRARHGIHNGPYRPLFNVADNSTLMIHRTQ